MSYTKVSIYLDIQQQLTSANELLLSNFPSLKWSINLLSYWLLEVLCLILQVSVSSSCVLLLLPSCCLLLLLLTGDLLLLLTLALGTVLVTWCLASSLSRLLLLLLRLLLLLLLLTSLVLAVWALFTSTTLTGAMLRGTSCLIRSRLTMSLSLALLLTLNFLLCRQVLLVVAILLRVVWTTLHSFY